MLDVRERAAALALVARAAQPWSETAGLIEEAGGALRVVAGELDRLEWFDRDQAAALGRLVTAELLDDYSELVEMLDGCGIRLVTICDPGYPANLRRVWDRPPFLFVRGSLSVLDERAVAVAGGRSPDRRPLEETRQLAAGLAAGGFTIVAGLARGAGAAACAAALDAGGRALAAFATGINLVEPPDLMGLARRILGRGAHVSALWPDARISDATRTARDALAAGLALGTLVVDGDAAEIAAHAHICLEQDRPLLLGSGLVAREPAAARYAGRPGVVVVDSVQQAAAGLAGGRAPVAAAAG
jgi:DNA processing protein